MYGRNDERKEEKKRKLLECMEERKEGRNKGIKGEGVNENSILLHTE